MNYREETKSVRIEGMEYSWVRAMRVLISNMLGETPYIKFVEEKVTNCVDGTQKHKILGELKEDFSKPDTVFNLIHPDTGSVIGSAKYSDLYVLLTSLYIHLAIKRDAE